MTDLSHFDFAESFTPNEAASLILGIDPVEAICLEDMRRRQIVLNRMDMDYRAAGGALLGYLSNGNTCADNERQTFLRSVLMETAFEAAKNTWPDWADMEFDFWLAGEDAAFDKQEFSRQELSRWLKSSGLASIYSFQRDGDAYTLPCTNKSAWPWGAHHTELLGHLESAARRFWVNYDPDDRETAPTNAQIIKWLKERGVSNAMAKAMATILRADGLPTGPRK